MDTDLEWDDELGAMPPRRPSRVERFRRGVGLEAAVAVAGFVAFATVVLAKRTALLEPDDYAYRASILALTHGWVLLTNAQHTALVHQLSHLSSPGIAQWDHLTGGRWISEKNPGYPFFAVVFQWLGILRAAPLAYGALAATGLFVGARRWLGRWGGTWAVLAYLSTGASMAFAWRATMPTFTDASLVAAGLGFGLWAMLADDHPRRRTVVGLVASLCLEAAVTIRYTDVVALLVAVVAVVAFARPAKLCRQQLVVWGGSLVAALGAVMAFNAAVYGGATKTGYAAGEITFSASAIVPNLRQMPWLLVQAMPIVLLAAVALGLGVARLLRRREGAGRTEARRDAAVLATLGLVWFGVFGLYLAYTWTAQMGSHGGGPGGGPGGGGGAIHLIRFYLPALGALALLAASVLKRIRVVPAVAVLVLLAGLGLGSFHSLTAGGAMGAGPGAGGPPSGIAGGPGRAVGPGGNHAGAGGPPFGRGSAGSGGQPPSGVPSGGGDGPPSGSGPPPPGGGPGGTFNSSATTR